MKALGGKFEIGVSREGMFWILVIKFVFFFALLPLWPGTRMSVIRGIDVDRYGTMLRATRSHTLTIIS